MTRDDLQNQHGPWLVEAVESILLLARNRLRFELDDVDAYLNSDPPFPGAVKMALENACKQGICGPGSKPGMFISQRFKRCMD